VGRGVLPRTWFRSGQSSARCRSRDYTWPACCGLHGASDLATAPAAVCACCAADHITRAQHCHTPAIGVVGRREEHNLRLVLLHGLDDAWDVHLEAVKAGHRDHLGSGAQGISVRVSPDVWGAHMHGRAMVGTMQVGHCRQLCGGAAQAVCQLMARLWYRTKEELCACGLWLTGAATRAACCCCAHRCSSSHLQLHVLPHTCIGAPSVRLDARPLSMLSGGTSPTQAMCCQRRVSCLHCAPLRC
jgi:hypothetical protein